MYSQKIETIKKKYPSEWLLIELARVDDKTTTPISGRLIFHSPIRHAIYSRLLSLKKRKLPLLVEYSSDRMPKGFVAAF